MRSVLPFLLHLAAWALGALVLSRRRKDDAAVAMAIAEQHAYESTHPIEHLGNHRFVGVVQRIERAMGRPTPAYLRERVRQRLAE